MPQEIDHHFGHVGRPQLPGVVGMLARAAEVRRHRARHHHADADVLSRSSSITDSLKATRPALVAQYAPAVAK